MNRFTAACCSCRSWWARTLVCRVYATFRSVLMDRHTDKILLLMCCLMLYYSWRLAAVAGWVHPAPSRVVPEASSGIADASARLTAASADFWGNVIPPGLTALVLSIAALGGLGALYTRNSGVKIGVMLIGVAFYLRSGGMLCWYSPDHLGGVPWLIQAGACAATARALVDVYVHDVLDLEQILRIAVQAGTRPNWSALPWLVRHRLRGRLCDEELARVQDSAQVAAPGGLIASGLKSAAKR